MERSPVDRGRAQGPITRRRPTGTSALFLQAERPGHKGRAGPRRRRLRSTSPPGQPGGTPRGSEHALARCTRRGSTPQRARSHPGWICRAPYGGSLPRPARSRPLTSAAATANWCAAETVLRWTKDRSGRRGSHAAGHLCPRPQKTGMMTPHSPENPHRIVVPRHDLPTWVPWREGDEQRTRHTTKAPRP